MLHVTIAGLTVLADPHLHVKMSADLLRRLLLNEKHVHRIQVDVVTCAQCVL